MIDVQNWLITEALFFYSCPDCPELHGPFEQHWLGNLDDLGSREKHSLLYRIDWQLTVLWLIKVAFPYCCSDCPSCMAHLNSINWASWAILATRKKHSLMYRTDWLCLAWSCFLECEMFDVFELVCLLTGRCRACTCCLCVIASVLAHLFFLDHFFLDLLCEEQIMLSWINIKNTA